MMLSRPLAKSPMYELPNEDLPDQAWSALVKVVPELESADRETAVRALERFSWNDQLVAKRAQWCSVLAGRAESWRRHDSANERAWIVERVNPYCTWLVGEELSFCDSLESILVAFVGQFVSEGIFPDGVDVVGESIWINGPGDDPWVHIKPWREDEAPRPNQPLRERLTSTLTGVTEARLLGSSRNWSSVSSACQDGQT